MRNMPIDNLEDVRYKTESEWFDYAFRHYSDFEEVKDSEFHRLRKAYVDAANALDKYLPEGEES